MKTSSYFTYRGPGRIGISMTVPDHLTDGLIMFGALAPRVWFKGADRNVYYDHYFQMLSALDPMATWEKLHDLAGGHEPVLLCWETPPFDECNFCHRHLVAQWFENELGFIVPEWAAEEIRHTSGR